MWLFHKMVFALYTFTESIVSRGTVKIGKRQMLNSAFLFFNGFKKINTKAKFLLSSLAMSYTTF